MTVEGADPHERASYTAGVTAGVLTRWPAGLSVSATTNPRLLVTLAALQFALFPVPTITLFLTDQIGLSLADVMVLQAAFSASVVLFEFPSGYFADRVGSRASLLVGAAGWSAGWLLYAGSESFAAVFLAEILLGASSAFVSGADRALLWVSLGAAGRSREYQRWEGRLRATAQISEALSAAVGGWLYARAPRLPLWVQVPTAALMLAPVLGLRDVPRATTDEGRSHAGRALHIVRFSLWHHHRLRATIGLGVALGLSTFVMVWLIQPYAQARGIPPAWFGALWAAAHLWLAGVSLVSARLTDALGVRATLLACCLLIPVGYLGLALVPSTAAVAFYLCFMTVRGLQGPIVASALQRDALEHDRASVLSLAALLFRLAFVVAGPPIGALVDGVGMGPALMVMAVGFTAASLLALRAFTRAHARATGPTG